MLVPSLIDTVTITLAHTVANRLANTVADIVARVHMCAQLQSMSVHWFAGKGLWSQAACRLYRALAIAVN